MEPKIKKIYRPPQMVKVALVAEEAMLSTGCKTNGPTQGICATYPGFVTCNSLDGS